MGIYINYVLSAEGTDEEIVNRLERVRQRCLDLPLRSVGEVRRMAPIYNSINLTLLQNNGYQMPPEVKQRFDAAEVDRDHGLRCLLFCSLMPGDGLSEDLKHRYIAPAVEFIDTTGMWRHEDLPAELTMGSHGTRYSINRAVIELEFVNVLLRYGYRLTIDPGEGSESVTLALSTYARTDASRTAEPPLWYGQGFTKTQYAQNFILVHETVCSVLDIVKAEGLLYSAGDNSGYYTDRTWEKAGQRVNDELAFAKIMSGVMDVAIGNLREEGMGVKVLDDNASNAKPVDFSSRLKPDSER